MEDLAIQGDSDDRYRELIKFVEGEQDWKTAPPHVSAYKSNISEIGVERIGRCKLLI